MCFITFFINIYYTYNLLKKKLNYNEKIYYFKKFTKYLSKNNFISFCKYFFLSIENTQNNFLKLTDEKINEIKINELLNEITEPHIDEITNLKYFLKDENEQKITTPLIIKNEIEINDIETEILLSDINFETKKNIIKIGKKKLN